MNANLKEIIATANEVFNFITDEYLQKRIIFECIVDSEFCRYVQEKISFFRTNFDYHKIEELFTEIHERTLRYLKSAPSKKEDILLSLSYFYLLEAFDEHCVKNDELIDKIKEAHPDDYLKVIADIDKIYLSDDMKSHALNIEHSKQEVALTDNNVNLYIVYKKWQDHQHSFYFKEFEKDIFALLDRAYLEYQSASDKEMAILTDMAMSLILKEDIVDISVLSLLTKLVDKSLILKHFGGKAYGLAKLAFINVPIPYTAVVPIDHAVDFQKLDEFIPQEIKYFSTRSSADIEDGEKHSFAGMFDSYLNVARDNLVENINKVKDSIHNKRLNSYIEKNNLVKPHMAVVIQSFAEPTTSGIWIGSNLDSGMLEYTEGNGEKIVSGEVIPKREIWEDKNCSENLLKAGSLTIGEELIKIQHILKTPSDFEWMILNNRLVLLQFRPVTTKINTKKMETISNDSTIVGVACSPGKVEGKLQFLNSPDEEFQAGNILLAWITDPDWLPHMLNAKGVITASGGFLCHAGIICRELGIPCVTGIGGDAIKRLSIMEDAKVILDGDQGIVILK